MNKILIITREFPPHVIGGAGFHSFFLAKSFLENNIKVTVFSAYNGSKDITETVLVNNNNFDINRITYFNKIIPRIWFNRKIIKILRNIDLTDYDAIISHEYIDFTKIKFGGKKILKTHINIFKKSEEYKEKKILHFFMNYFIWPFERSLEKKSLFSADIIIHNSRLTRNLYIQKFPELKKIEQQVVYNGVESDKFEFCVDKKKYFLFVGGDSRRKGFNNILKLAKLLPDDFTIKIAGTMNKKNRNIVNNIHNIEYIGKISQSDLIHYYKNALVLVHPCFYEPFGNVIFEALACGSLAIISNEKYCGAAEIIPNSFSIRVDPYDIKINLDELKNKLSKINRKELAAFIKQNSWNLHCNKIINLILK
ncbi:MAG: glycosyltransferase family 4 protein [Patescibacteria group bacterium]